VGGLLGRVVFAHDYRKGQELVASERFDLCILDSDFPAVVSEEREKRINEFLARLRKGERPTPDYISAMNERGVVRNHFVDFYSSLLKEGPASVVVFSSSEGCVWHARSLGLPFYTKNSDRVEHIPAVLRQGNQLYASHLSAKGWEYGGPAELIRRYLV
jgi:hypothetical protein